MGHETVVVSAAATPPAAAQTPTALAPGFRFHPTDEELVIYYLKRKVCGKSFRFDAISEVDIYKSEPWDLADKSRLKTRDQEWYFFSALDRKYGNGGRMNRATSKGYWKATGNDRPVRHESRTVGLKKTLVFHSGRAPDGKRTNWVMHEYRLVDEELEKLVGRTENAYVLCRVFHKNNIGPPNGQRYAPFIEEEWDDPSAIIPGAEAGNGLPGSDQRLEGGDHALTEGNRTQGTQSRYRVPLDVNALPIETQHLLAVCKRESEDDDPSPDMNDPKPVSLMYKRRRYNISNSSDSNHSQNSNQTSQDPSSSTTTSTAATTLPTTTTTTSFGTKKSFLSALVEYSLLESLEPKDNNPDRLSECSPDNLDLPPSCIKFIHNLQSKIAEISLERETLKFEMMSAQAMINILQSRLDLVSKENEALKKSIQDP